MQPVRLTLAPSLPPARKAWHLVIYISLSLLLHLVFLLAIRTPTIKTSNSQRNPLTVFLFAPPVSESIHIAGESPKKKHATPVQTQNSRVVTSPVPSPIAPVEATRSEVITPPDIPKALSQQQLLESSHSFARDEARKIEQHSAALEKERLNTPAGLLEQYLKQPHKEMQLADGTLKIITDAGAVCFKPAPYFASGDIEKRVFGVASTCP